MENENNNAPVNTEAVKCKKDTFFTVIITEAVYIAVILAAVLIIKYFFPAVYGEVKEWYRENLLTETSVSEVLDTGDGDEV